MNIKDKALSILYQVNDIQSRNPILKGLIDGCLSEARFIGPAITSALNTRVFQLHEKNSKLFAHEVRALMNTLDESNLDKDYVESDEFVSLLVTVLSRNAYVYDTEKVKLYAKVFVNATTSANSSVPYKEGFVQIIDDLSVDHIRILAFVHERSRVFTEDDRERNLDRVSAEEAADTLGIEVGRVLAYCEQLVRFGLLRDWGVGRIDYQPGRYDITEYGNEFTAFLEAES